MKMPTQVSVGKLFALITGAISVLGFLKSILSVGTGEEFSLQQLAFYVGNVAIFVYISVIAGGLLGGLADEVIGKQAPNAVLWVWGLSSVAIAVLLVLSGAGYGYGDLDAFGTGAVALLGLAALAGGVWAWRHFSAKEAPAA